jgi:hypothetical protein
MPLRSDRQRFALAADRTLKSDWSIAQNGQMRNSGGAGNDPGGSTEVIGELR